MKNENTPLAIYFVFIAIALTSWITNIVQFASCDFNTIGKEEVIKGVGTFIPPASIITVWL